MSQSDCTPRDGTQRLTVSAACARSLSPGQRPSGVEACPPTFRTEAADRTRAAIHTGHRLASKRVSARLIPEHTLHPGFDAICTFRCFNSGELSSPSRSPTDASCAPFPQRSPRQSSANAAWGALKPPPAGRLRRATNPPSPVQLHIPGDRSPYHLLRPTTCNVRGTQSAYAFPITSSTALVFPSSAARRSFSRRSFRISPDSPGDDFAACVGEAVSVPRACARRHFVTVDSYNPSRRSRAPRAPCSVSASYSVTIASLYASVNVRRTGCPARGPTTPVPFPRGSVESPDGISAIDKVITS